MQFTQEGCCIKYLDNVSAFEFARFFSEFLSNSSRIPLPPDKMTWPLFFEPKIKEKLKAKTIYLPAYKL